MTPIVFCASCRPCPSAIADAEKVCENRNPRFVLCGFRLRNPHMMASISRNARPNPITGDSSIGMTPLSQNTDQCTRLPDATAAPTRPPMSECDDDDGSP